MATALLGLTDREKLCFFALERTRMPLIVANALDSEMPIVLANRAFLELTQYSADEVVGRNCRFLQGPGTDPTTVQAIRVAINAGQEFTGELLNYRKDGSSFWNELHLSPLHDDEGRVVFYFGSQIDVTERRAAQDLRASEHRLLREVDHRAMNVLALVNGIVRLSRADDPKAYAKAVQERVHALAQAHAVLGARGWTPVPLRDLLSPAISAFDPEHVVAEGPDVRIAAAHVQSLALVMHELMANAVRHGALSVPSGILQIRWTALDRGAGALLTWREHGAPPPAERREGFGSTLVRATVERQLRGRLTRVWGEHGLEYDIALPANVAHATADV